MCCIGGDCPAEERRGVVGAVGGGEGAEGGGRGRDEGVWVWGEERDLGGEKLPMSLVISIMEPLLQPRCVRVACIYLASET